MKKPLLFILLLMSLCVAGIIGLQLFWNFQNYRTTVKEFDHDINEALNNAVVKETNQRQELIVKRFESWLSDTSLITITADHNDRDSSTKFYTSDTHPQYKEDQKRKFEFGLTDFKEKLDRITPAAKAFMINHFGERILKRDLKDGTIYHYTQLLGDSLEKVFNASKVNDRALWKLFRGELRAKSINAEFVLNPVKTKGQYLTNRVNTNFKKPYKSDFVFAGFESPDRYFFREMRWVIITSLLLIIITISCFSYTINTLLSQQKLAELKNNFVNNMTHELNTPITSIKITAEALKSFQQEPERQIEYLDIISYQADKLSDLTGQILQSSQLIKAKSATWKQVDMNELITAAIDDLEPQIERAKAVVNYKPMLPVSVIVDAESLTRVLINLIDNALKYYTGIPKISIVLAATIDQAELKIIDNGPGIPEEYHQQVFEQFFRVPQGNLHDVKGFGLGLDYVKQVVKQHKGEVFLNSNQPSGCIFIVKLPLCHD